MNGSSSSLKNNREAVMYLIVEMDHAISEGKVSQFLDLLPHPSKNTEEVRDRRKIIGNMHRRLGEMRDKIQKKKAEVESGEEEFKKNAKFLRDGVEAKIADMRRDMERKRTLDIETKTSLEREHDALHKEITALTQQYIAKDKNKKRLHFSQVFHTMSEALCNEDNVTSRRRHSSVFDDQETRDNTDRPKRDTVEKKNTAVEKKDAAVEQDPFDFSKFNNNGYGSFIPPEGGGGIDTTLVQAMGQIFRENDTVVERPPPMDDLYSSNGSSKLFVQDTDNKTGGGDGLSASAPVPQQRKRVAEKVPRKQYTEKVIGKKPVSYSEQQYTEDNDDDVPHHVGTETNALIDALGTKLKETPCANFRNKQGEEYDIFTSDDDGGGGDDVTRAGTNQEEEEQPFSESSGSESDSSSSEYASDYDVDENGRYNPPIPGEEENEAERMIRMAIDKGNRERDFDDDVAEQMSKLKYTKDPEIERKRQRKEEKKEKEKNSVARASLHSVTSDVEGKNNGAKETPATVGKKRRRKRRSSDASRDSGKKRGRPADYENVAVDWSNPVLPKVGLTRREASSDPEKMANYGGYKDIPKYDTQIHASGKCNCCGIFYKECQRRCLKGHLRSECGGYPDKECTPEMLAMRHDRGFYTEEDMSKVVDMLRSDVTDPKVKKAQFKLARGYFICYWCGGKTGWKLASMAVDSIKWGASHNDEWFRCPCCMFKDTTRKAPYMLCTGCCNSKKIKAGLEFWRLIAGVPIKKRAKTEKKKISSAGNDGED